MPLARMMLSSSQRCSSKRRTCGSPRLSSTGCGGWITFMAVSLRSFFRILKSAHLRHVDEWPGAWHVADRHLDQCRLVGGEALLECLAQRFGIGGAVAKDAEALGEPDEIRIGEVGADQAIAVQALLHVA